MNFFWALVCCLPPFSLPPTLLRSAFVSLIKGKRSQTDFLVSFFLPSTPGCSPSFCIPEEEKESAGILPRLSASFSFFFFICLSKMQDFWIYSCTLWSCRFCSSWRWKEGDSAKCPHARMLLSWPPVHYDFCVLCSVRAWKYKKYIEVSTEHDPIVGSRLCQFTSRPLATFAIGCLRSRYG